jgi:primase-polymerase (primpol)-like protein
MTKPRAIAVTVAPLPCEIRDSTRAVAWCYEHVKGDRWTKVPYQPRRPRVKASSTDPATWGAFAEALAVVRAGKADGVGIVLVGDGLCGVDLDHVRDGGTRTVATDAAAIVRQVHSYTEVSPSGTGLRVFAWGTLPPGGRKKGGVEVYDRARFLTVTGAHVPGTPRTIEERTAELATLHRQVFGAPAAPSAPRRSSAPPDLDDARLLERAHAARNGSSFAALWAGDTSAYGSHSEADLALCNALAFWTGGDAARVGRLFRQSGLYRPKWDAGRSGLTYGDRTIACALAGRR